MLIGLINLDGIKFHLTVLLRNMISFRISLTTTLMMLCIISSISRVEESLLLLVAMLLKSYNCSLPIEVFYLGEELNSYQKDTLSSRVQIRDLQEELSRYNLGLSFSLIEGAKNYHIKGFVVFSASALFGQ